MNRLSRVLAVAGISGALAVGGAGLAQASPDHSGHKNDACKKLHGKQRRDCEKKHHHR